MALNGRVRKRYAPVYIKMAGNDGARVAVGVADGVSVGVGVADNIIDRVAFAEREADGSNAVGVVDGVIDSVAVSEREDVKDGVLDADAPRESVDVDVGESVGVTVDEGEGGVQAVRMIEPSAPAPVVGEPPTKVTAPTSVASEALRKEEPPPPPLGKAAEP